MKCSYCGYDIPEGMLYCEQCGNEVCIVPDYNPLDEMLTAQIKVALDGSEEEQLHRTPNQNTAGKNTKAGTTGRTGATGRTGVTGRTGANRSTNGQRRRPGANTTGKMRADKEERRRQMERKKALRRKKRRKVLLILALIVALLVTGCILLYRNSYTGLVSRGYKASKTQEYTSASTLFEKAISKNKKKAEAYTGLSKAYLAQNDADAAEKVFSEAVADQPGNADIYEAYIAYYMDTEQQMEIPVLLDDAKESVQDTLAGYIVAHPSFSLDDSVTYDDVQQLTLETKAKDIYYTTDGSEPTTKSEKYKDHIQIKEGETEIKAISVDKRGVPSLAAKKTYTVELPIEDAPSIAPSTGQYSEATPIEIKVPEGYTAYYTLDKEDPTTASTKYEGPIDMPEGETIIKAILVNADGRASGVTTRNYLYEP